MDRLDAMVEQHVRESELRMRHVDELMDRARDAAAGHRPVDDPLLARVEAAREAMAAAVQGLRHGPAGERDSALAHGHGLRATLETVGLELERALATVVTRPD